MTEYTLFNEDNMRVMDYFLLNDIKFDLIYSDMIYENKDFSWVDSSYKVLKENGIFIVQLDYHNVAQMKIYLDNLFGENNFVNWCIYINDWGGTPRKGFPNKHDDILIYAKGENWKWDKSGIQIPKATAGTKFDKKGTGVKTPCDVFYDHASFSTVASERVKQDDGHNIQWQKPLWLMDRIIRPFTSEGDMILDNFMGSASLGEWCLSNNRCYTGIENDKDVFKLAEERLDKFV